MTRGASGVRGNARQSKVRWDFLERRIASSDKAYQRQIIRKKIDELVGYYEQCRQARDLPSIPGAVIISCDEALKFESMPGEPSLGAGEASQGPTAAAIGNAVFDALGIRIRQLPITPERILAAVSSD